MSHLSVSAAALAAVAVKVMFQVVFCELALLLCILYVMWLNIKQNIANDEPQILFN